MRFLEGIDRKKALPWVASAGIITAILLFLYPPWESSTEKLMKLDLGATKRELAARPLDHEKRLSLARYYLQWGLMISEAEEPYEQISTDSALRGYFSRRLDEWQSSGEDVSALRSMLKSNLPVFRQEFVAREREMAKTMFDQAVIHYRQARALGASLSPRDLYDLGTAYYQMGPEGYAGAAECLREAVDAGLVSTRALTFLGNVEVARGNLDEAVTYYGKALELHSEDPIVGFNLALAYKEKGEYSQAIEHFRFAIHHLQAREELSEGDLTIMLQSRLALGWCLLQRGDFVSAARELEAVVESQPDSLEGNYWLGVAYEGEMRMEAARSHWQKVIQLEPSFRDARARLDRLAELARPSSPRR